MGGSDERQTQDKRTREEEQGAGNAPEEYTTYREVKPDSATPGDAAARREADLQPAPSREAEPDRNQ